MKECSLAECLGAEDRYHVSMENSRCLCYMTDCIGPLHGVSWLCVLEQEQEWIGSGSTLADLKSHSTLLVLLSGGTTHLPYTHIQRDKCTCTELKLNKPFFKKSRWRSFK